MTIVTKIEDEPASVFIDLRSGAKMVTTTGEAL